MLDDSTPCFPNNVVDLLVIRMKTIDEDLFVDKRPLRTTDPPQSIGLFGSLWTPDDTSIEMKGSPFSTPGPQEPTIQRYSITIQGMIIDTEEDRGLFTHSLLAKLIRSMLYRDMPLRVGLTALSVTLEGATEKTTRWGVGQTRYLSNEVRGNWIYLSTQDFWLETEIT